MRPLPLDPGEFNYTRCVQFAETDLAGIVHFSAYFRYMEEAEHALWRAAGLSVASDGLHWPRVTAYCEYTNPLHFEDEITVKVRAGFGRRRIQYGFEIRRTDTVAAIGVMTSVCTRANAAGTLESIEIPQDLVVRLRGALR
jgi:YbgC/YbaW family acyl-CoA thioester hydrolase